ncbi:MAG: allophanate hydrolase, partial [Gammaproteobacteria bacterium HGW-Gammaproteobacteria-14]
TLDCPSLFALDPLDAARISALIDGFDRADDFSRMPQAPLGLNVADLRIAVPAPGQRRFYGSQSYEASFSRVIDQWRSLGATIVEVDFSPFIEAALLLYEGPWVTERWLTAEPLLQQSAESLLPVTREIIASGAQPSAADAFRAQYRLAALQKQAAAVFDNVDLLLTPSAGRHFRISDIEQQPIQHNSELGYYTNFMNLLDLSAVAVPAGFTETGLPFGITLTAPAFADESLLAIAQRWLQRIDQPIGACGYRLADTPLLPVPGRIEVAVCGAHLSGMPLNHQLTSRGGWLSLATHSAPCYRLYALPGGPPFRPGMVRDEAGAAIEVEVWSIPEQYFGSFVAAIPAPLGIGKVELTDGRWVTGFICEGQGIDGAEDITAFGGWRSYMSRKMMSQGAITEAKPLHQAPVDR